MTARLPPRIDFAAETTVSGLGQRIGTFVDAVIDFLRATVRDEFVDFDTLLTGPEYVKIEMQRPIGAVIVAAYGPTGAPIVATLAWQVSDDPRRPGIKVTVDGPGMTAGQLHAITLRVMGRN